ncbi:MAG: hypothetical protein PSV13_10825 [Lacunisphaera sp.]|nr:hypothetical protein [Lacunisphaera sp.]
MKIDAPAFTGTPVHDKRSRNKLVLGAMGFLCGILVTSTGRFLADYHGPWGIRLGLVLAPWALVGLLAVFSRRLYQADELEALINRQALAFAFYAALFGLVVVHQLQSAGFVAVFAWTTPQLIMGMVLLMAAGILWSKRRYI